MQSVEGLSLAHPDGGFVNRLTTISDSRSSLDFLPALFATGATLEVLLAKVLHVCPADDAAPAHSAPVALAWAKAVDSGAIWTNAHDYPSA